MVTLQMKTETRNVPALSMRGSFAPKSVDEDNRTVELVWTTGARVLRGYYERFFEELSLDPKHVRLERLNNGAPFLADHDGYSVARTLGVVESARLEKGRGVAVVRFAKAEDDPEADKVFRKIKDGIIQNVSVGYRIHKLEKVEESSGEIPVYRATDWEPFEISAVAMGADDGAGFRSAADPKETNRCEFITRGLPHEESRKMEKTEQELAAEKAAAEKRAAEIKAATEAGIKAERERVSGITSAVRAAKLGDDFAAKLIADDVALDKARAMVLDELAKGSEEIKTESHVRITDDGADRFARGATAWLLQKGGSDVVKRAAKAGVEGFEKIEFDPGEFRGASIADLARMFLASKGIQVRGFDKVAIVKRAMQYRSPGMASTSDFPTILENVLHKTMLGAYAITPDTWRRFCKVGSVSDFRSHHRYRNGSFGTLDTLSEHGEYKSKSIPDAEKASVQVAAYGNMIALTRQVIVNDDMGAFTGLAERFGRSAALTIESKVYAMLGLNSGLGPLQSDNEAFFHSNRKNVNATGSALTVAGLDADAVVMASQTDPSGNEILQLTPKVLLVPLSLGGTAKVLNGAQYDPDTANKLQKPNMVQNMFSDIVATGRLSGTRRYLFADPSTANAIEVSFLEGAQGPALESQDGWRVDGTEWKVSLDFGVDFVDPRGAVTNAGQ